MQQGMPATPTGNAGRTAMPGPPGAPNPKPTDPHAGVLDLQEEVLHAMRAATR